VNDTSETESGNDNRGFLKNMGGPGKGGIQIEGTLTDEYA